MRQYHPLDCGCLALTHGAPPFRIEHTSAWCLVLSGFEQPPFTERQSGEAESLGPRFLLRSGIALVHTTGRPAFFLAKSAPQASAKDNVSGASGGRGMMKKRFLSTPRDPIFFFFFFKRQRHQCWHHRKPVRDSNPTFSFLFRVSREHPAGPTSTGRHSYCKS